MAGVNRMVGTPWHVGKFERQEDDPRRHRVRCKHYNKVDKNCFKRNGRCIGSAHCLEYDEAEHQDIPTVEIEPKQNLRFTGIKEIPIGTIEIPEKYKCHVPSEEKVNELVAYYHKNGHIDKPIIVLCGNGEYVLEDKYLRYVVAVRLGLKTVPAQIATYKEAKQIDKFKKVGRKVQHIKLGKGEVVAADSKMMTIRFESGLEKRFDIQMCIEKGYVKLM